MIYNFSAPAKINLGLEVLNKRDDNFHNIKTIFQFLDWGDEISLDTNTKETKIICSDLPQEENIIHKLLSILGEKIEAFKDYIKNKFSVSDIHYEKQYDMEINLSSVNLDLYKSIAKLQPYGMGNPKPKFLIRLCIKTFVKTAAEIHLIVYFNDIYGN